MSKELPPAQHDEIKALLLARRTDWRELAPDVWCGLGQRLLGSDAGEHALMDVRQIDFGAAASTPDDSAGHG